MELNLLENQAELRRAFLQAILDSPSRNKLIVAGPGTGKTFTFGTLIRQSGEGDKLALTFIRRLVADMYQEFGDIAEVKTFHSYCKRLLHERFGSIELAPYLNSIMIQDAVALGHPPVNFRRSFQTLDEESWEIAFYLVRGDYYAAVSFDDAVYRVYREVNRGNLQIPDYELVVIDEYQDFNILEVSFLEILRQNNPILIVGDDDQAVYQLRNSSSQYLRERYSSGEFDSFELPFCSRCPRCVVDATDNFIQASQNDGALSGRVPRRFIPFLEGKEDLNDRYPSIAIGQTTNVACLRNLVTQIIEGIPEGEHAEARRESYPSVLIVGKRQYLNPLYKVLEGEFSDISFSQSSEPSYSYTDAYHLLLDDDNSNLGWRILAGLELPEDQLNDHIRNSNNGGLFRQLLSEEFITKHQSVLGELRREDRTQLDLDLLNRELGDDYLIILDHFFPEEPEDCTEFDPSEPSILLSSFEGCKGLSAGHVILVGINEGEMPSLSVDGEVDDIEYSKFIVGMTRTRYQLYIFSNRWFFKPENPGFTPSRFVSMLPEHLVTDYGYIKSANIGTLIEGVFG